MNRSERAGLGEETLRILRKREYATARGRVDLGRDIDAMNGGTRVVRPGEWDAIIADARSACRAGAMAKVEVTGETTLEAARRLVVTQGRADVAALNFASAKNPGGGFLSGAQAQEESLARSSALYLSLEAAPQYYQANRRHSSPAYTDHAILSPAVPVMRDDNGRLLDEPYAVTFITMPAANVGALRPGSPDLRRVPNIMEHRMRCVLALAVSAGCRSIVLGAWGCGVFRQDPDLIASLFAVCLSGEDSWRSCFDRIVFAILDTSPSRSTPAAFERHLGQL